VPGISQLRIRILIALAIGEIAGVAYFSWRAQLNPLHGGAALSGFLKLSLMSIALVASYLWQDWFSRRGIRYFEVCAVIVLGAASIVRPRQMQAWQVVLNACLAALFLIAMLPRLFRPASAEKEQSKLRIAEPRGKTDETIKRRR
jgi:hypothetical protein